MIFVGLITLMSQLNTLRMSISVSIALYSLISMHEKRWITALIIIICAASVQISAVILLPVLIVLFIAYNRNNYRKSLLFALIGLGIIFTIAMFGLINRIALGTDKSVNVGHSSVAWSTDLAIIIFSAICFANFKQLKNTSGLNEVLMMALPVGIICIPLQFNISVMYRMLLYFLPIIYSLIPSIIKSYSNNKNKLKYFAVIIIAYGYLFSRVYSFISEEIVFLNEYRV